MTVCLAFAPGCSLTLFGVGAIYDAAKPDYDELKGKEIEAIPEHSEVSVHTVSGSSSKGEFDGILDEQNSGEKPATYMRLITTDGIQDIDLGNVVYVRKKNSHNAKWGLLVSGAIIDGMIAYFLLSFLYGMGSSFGE